MRSDAGVPVLRWPNKLGRMGGRRRRGLLERGRVRSLAIPGAGRRTPRAERTVILIAVQSMRLDGSERFPPSLPGRCLAVVLDRWLTPPAGMAAVPGGGRTIGQTSSTRARSQVPGSLLPITARVARRSPAPGVPALFRSPRAGSPSRHPAHAHGPRGRAVAGKERAPSVAPLPQHARASLAAVIPLTEPLLEGFHEFAQRALCRDSGIKISKATSNPAGRSGTRTSMRK